MYRLLAAVLIGAVSCAPARANDSTAELETGGLVLTRSANIEMRAEDLAVSTKEIKVRYRFFNTSDKDVTTLVAFPMPDITIDGSDSNISVPTEDPENLLGFSTTVEGRKVDTRVEQKVFAKGVEHTALLKGLGIPLAPHLASTNEALDKLPQEKWDEFVRLGLAEVEEYDSGSGMKKHLGARWTLKTTYFWEQAFPAKRELAIEHRYQPSVGATVQTSLGAPDQRQTDWFKEYLAKYCMDKEFLGAVERARKAAKSEYGAPFMEERLSYILVTGANWAGPIKDFRLTVDKGEAASLVSFCGEGVKKIGPTLFEMRKANFTPARNLHVLILKKLPPQ